MNTKPINSDLIRLLDLTRLNEADDEAIIFRFCQKATTPSGSVAAVCVLPQFVSTAKSQLTAVPVAAVVNFPQGFLSISDTCEQILSVIRDGADEIDVVMPYHLLLSGEVPRVMHFLEACRNAANNKILKVIIESGALEDEKLICLASKLVIASGADFIKTSTGKIPAGATLSAAKIILNTIKQNPQKKIGLKISGGVKMISQAQDYIALAENIMGKDWVSPQTFRIGASSLLNNILSSKS